MSKQNHTPGPWEHTGPGDIVGKEDNGYGLGYVDVCSVYLRTVRGRTNANARLIAAAPELLDALQAMTEIAEMTIGWLPTPPNADGPLIQARAAIAKATGGKA